MFELESLDLSSLQLFQPFHLIDFIDLLSLFQIFELLLQLCPISLLLSEFLDTLSDEATLVNDADFIGCSSLAHPPINHLVSPGSPLGSGVIRLLMQLFFLDVRMRDTRLRGLIQVSREGPCYGILRRLGYVLKLCLTIQRVHCVVRVVSFPQL